VPTIKTQAVLGFFHSGGNASDKKSFRTCIRKGRCFELPK
jgi:hypothetical protein